eukprot:TRINITY_DN7577_c0_g1_i1.p1 TRINITY_DN7577_c0_g1~~TRINITY_DN7577_c0_g1_i1.p1  ORF type:complete len:269 (+),score=81.52 TRINITY_DN7577_c0_g1_i1:691-1497(+)
MKQYQVAVNTAVASGEIDVVYGILSHMRTKGVPLNEIITYCGRVDGCIPYLLSYARERATVNNSNELLAEIYGYIGKPDDSAVAKRLVMEGAREQEEYETFAKCIRQTRAYDIEKSLETLLSKMPKAACTRVKPIAEHYYNFLSYVLTDMKKKEVKISEEVASAQGPFEFLLLLAKEGDKKEIVSAIDGLAKKLKIEMRYVQMLKLRAFAMTENWGSFQELIKKEKPKVLPKFFAGLCIEFKNKELATGYINMLPIAEEKVDLFLELE